MDVLLDLACHQSPMLMAKALNMLDRLMSLDEELLASTKPALVASCVVS